MPSKLFENNDETKSMRDLGLAPSAVLVVIPEYRGSSSPSSGIFSWLWALVFFPISKPTEKSCKIVTKFQDMIIRALSSVFPPAQQAAPVHQQPQSSSASQPQRVVKIYLELQIDRFLETDRWSPGRRWPTGLQRQLD